MARVYLRRSATGELTEATLLDEVTDEHLNMWNQTWEPEMRAYCQGRAMKDKPEDHHWNWKLKASEWRPLLGYHSFAITCEGELQGLMLASDFKSARLASQFGKPIVYVEFLATAPWNREQMEALPRFRGTGTVMLAAAVELSEELGYRGRVGLHALPKAERFYREKCGMSELGTDAAHEDLMYYEMTEKQAKKFNGL